MMGWGGGIQFAIFNKAAHVHLIIIISKIFKKIWNEVHLIIHGMQAILVKYILQESISSCYQ